MVYPAMLINIRRAVSISRLAFLPLFRPHLPAPWGTVRPRLPRWALGGGAAGRESGIIRLFPAHPHGPALKATISTRTPGFRTSIGITTTAIIPSRRPPSRNRRAHDGPAFALLASADRPSAAACPRGRSRPARNRTGRHLATWVDVGLPDERAIRRPATGAARVVVLAYGGKAVDTWWRQNQGRGPPMPTSRVLPAHRRPGAALAALAARTMKLQSPFRKEPSGWDESRQNELAPERAARLRCRAGSAAGFAAATPGGWACPGQAAADAEESGSGGPR